MLPRSFALSLAALLLALPHCGKQTGSPPEAGSTTPATASEPASTSSASPTPATAEPPAAAPDKAPDIAGLAALEKELRDGYPDGSGDYARPLALAMLYKRGTITFEKLEAAIVALRLPPHELGDAYLMTPSPTPPPGVDFNRKRMPKDWQGTWGEVSMAFHLGVLDRDQYSKLHRAAHPTSCGHE